MQMYEEIIIVTLIAFTIVGLYGLGSLTNRLISNKHLKKTWRQLRKIGVEGEYKSLGSSGFIISLENPNKNISRVDVSIILEKREFPLNWIIDRLRGKRDTLTISIIYKNMFLPERVEIFRRGNYYGDSLYKYRSNLEKVKDLYLAPSKLIKNRKIKKLTSIMDRYSGIYFITYEANKNMLVLASSIKEIDNLNRIINQLFSIQ